MQTIEKALHQPMPFTTGGQTISDRLTAAKHSLAGSQLGKTICKATTEELMAPKKKHLDYLLHCTNEPNVSIPSMANLLIERTQHPSWTVVYKALITIHNIMCYGNERFSQYLASCNTTFNLGNFLDKNSTSGFRSSPSSYSYSIDQAYGGWYPGYDMSQHVRRYGKYIGEKIATYRVCAFDFCKVKRGREDGLLRTMHTDKLLKTLPILQNQIDALLEFHVSSSELNNGVINCSFILLFRDLIRLFACYNDGIINLLEKYFDMNKKQCREALDTYKGFLTRLDKVAEFLRVAESVGIDRGEIPDLTRAPASLLEALEAHLIHLEGGRPPPPSQQYNPIQQQLTNFSIAGGFQAPANVNEAERQRYLELEKERLRQFEEQKRQQASTGAQFNPFLGDAPAANSQPQKQNDDLLDLFHTAQAPAPAVDPTNPFAQFTAPAASTAQPQQQMYNPMGVNSVPMYPMSAAATTSAYPTFPQHAQNGARNEVDSNPFLAGGPPDGGAATFNPFAMSDAGNTPTYPTSTVTSQPPPAPSVEPTPVDHAAPLPISQQQKLGIYDQTPYSGTDGSYTAPTGIPEHLINQISAASSAEQSPAHQGYVPPPTQGTFDPFNTSTTTAATTGDVTALTNMTANMSIAGNGQTGMQWGAAPVRPPAPAAAATTAMTMPYNAGQPFQTQAYPAQYGAPQMWPAQQPGMYQMGQQPMQPYNMQMYGNPAGVPYGQQMGQPQQQAPQMPATNTQQQPKDPFSGY